MSAKAKVTYKDLDKIIENPPHYKDENFESFTEELFNKFDAWQSFLRDCWVKGNWETEKYQKFFSSQMTIRELREWQYDL